MDTLRAEIRANIDQYEHEIGLRRAQVETLNNVLSAIDELTETELAAAAASDPPDSAARAPRRDIKGTVLQAVRDYMEAKGLGPRLEDVQIGAGILLGSDLTESATRRALDALIAKGQMRLHDNRYASGSVGGNVVAALREAVAHAKSESVAAK